MRFSISPCFQYVINIQKSQQFFYNRSLGENPPNRVFNVRPYPIVVTFFNFSFDFFVKIVNILSYIPPLKNGAKHMQVKHTNTWWFSILMVSLPLFAQNSASHQVCIRIVRSNALTLTNVLSTSPAASQPVALLKWQVDNHLKKITLNVDKNAFSKPVRIQTDFQRVHSIRFSGSDRDLLTAGLEGNGQCLLKILQEKNKTAGPVQLSLTIVEI
jgi:hypothetical protein